MKKSQLREAIKSIIREVLNEEPQTKPAPVKDPGTKPTPKRRPLTPPKDVPQPKPKNEGEEAMISKIVDRFKSSKQ